MAELRDEQESTALARAALSLEVAYAPRVIRIVAWTVFGAAAAAAAVLVYGAYLVARDGENPARRER